MLLVDVHLFWARELAPSLAWTPLWPALACLMTCAVPVAQFCLSLPIPSTTTKIWPTHVPLPKQYQINCHHSTYYTDLLKLSLYTVTVVPTPITTRLGLVLMVLRPSSSLNRLITHGPRRQFAHQLTALTIAQTNSVSTTPPTPPLSDTW